MIPDFIELTAAIMGKDEVVIVPKNDQVINHLKEFGKLLSNKTNINHLIVQKAVPAGVEKKVEVDYEKIEKIYGEKTPVIVGKIATLSLESIKNKISNGVFKLNLDSTSFEFPAEFIKEKEVNSKKWDVLDLKNMKVFISKTA